ncbi:serine/arginine repetitive matrix protein 5-like isoform X1 [Asterias rubens]|uniref:serine/arginine repetitive matrix protein 5-like isoform X1 n=1 Tax=Asterias rubens TaxID=7604 RepID=UPI0014555F1E|nr:serine/arginine repetitive matrix protein 5-like isoform X1 [Asterias rubens]XP_033625088.1 serine/arginine repetitive matrix protein 5-like isoform X1 [Asterias rubens]XP_033625089.1 serine/arginine repetitive matrix protein 5-like isoform X1 [Asterias rubens]
MAMKRFVCTDSLLMLPISGAFVCLLGVVLLILYIVARGLTASLYHIEGSVPTYVAATLLILTGTLMAVLLKKRPNLLIYLAIAVNCLTFCVCALQAVSVGIVSIPFLGSFSACVYHTSLSECQCYILSAKENNSTGIIVPGADSEKVTFQDVRSCGVIEHNMIDFLYILCIIYGFAGIATLVTDTLLFMLVCSQRRATKEAHGLPSVGFIGQRRTPSNNQGEVRSSNRENGQRSNPDPSHSTSATTTGVCNEAPNRRATIGHHDARNQRPRVVQRSSSTSATHGRQPARHTSANASGDGHANNAPTGRGASAPSHVTPRQGRPPALIRGGYLQSHVNGPSIPVYIVPGSSNEAYIALTDLPSLHLSSLDTVPSYVSEISDLYPNDQPPPYSPTPDERHPSSFSVIMESPPTTPINENRRAQSHTHASHHDDSIQQSSVEQAGRDNVNTDTGGAVATTESVGALENASTQNNSLLSDHTEVVETDTVPEVQAQAAQLNTIPANAPRQSPNEHTTRVETIQEESSLTEQSHQSNSLERSGLSNGDTSSPIVTEVPVVQQVLPTVPSGQSSGSQPQESQHSSVRERQGPSEAESRSHNAAQNLAQGARPKHRQPKHRSGEEAHAAHTRSSSPPRRSSPSRRSTSPNRRQNVAPVTERENLSRHPVRENPSTSRDTARARSNSRGRQRHLPDILPRIDHLQDTEIKNSPNSARQPPVESSSTRARPHQKKHKQQSSDKKREPSPQRSSRQDANSQRPPKNPLNPLSQTTPKTKSKERQSKHKDPARKDRKHQGELSSRKSGKPTIVMNIPPNPNSSSTESLANILTLVESVHSSVKMKPKKERKSHREIKANLIDSRV